MAYAVVSLSINSVLQFAVSGRRGGVRPMEGGYVRGEGIRFYFPFTQRHKILSRNTRNSKIYRAEVSIPPGLTTVLSHDTKTDRRTELS